MNRPHISVGMPRMLGTLDASLSVTTTITAITMKSFMRDSHRHAPARGSRGDMLCAPS